MPTINGTANAETLDGTASDDTIDGMGGSDTLLGLDGNDRLIGGTGGDRLEGGGGNDTYVVDSILDVVVEKAGEGADLVESSVTFTLDTYLENVTLTGTASVNAFGNVFANILIGNSGANILNGRGGNDQMIGGAGDDTYYVDTGLDTVFEEEGGGIDLVISTVDFTLGATFEHLSLRGTAQYGVGNAFNNVITGSDGDNTLYGKLGDDTLDGGAGNDVLWGEEGRDTLIGGSGDDIYRAIKPEDVLIETANGGIDLVQAYFDYTLPDNFENLRMEAHTGIGNAVANYMSGLSGVHLMGLAGDDRLEAEEGRNTLEGGIGKDTLRGGTGNDVLDGGAGADKMAGGDGDDIFIVDDVADQVDGLGGGIDTVQSSLTFTLGAGLENLTLTGNAAINGTGNQTKNVLIGNDGDNVLDGQFGADDMRGGKGNDTFVVNDVFDGVSEQADEGVDTVRSSVNYALGANVENLTLLGNAATGTGNGLNNVLRGNSVANTLDGGTGDDTIEGGNGADTLIGGTGFDEVSYDSASSAVSLNIMTGAHSGAAAGDSFSGFEAYRLSGFNDQFVGSVAAEVIDGGAGADTLQGRGGDDYYYVDRSSDRVLEASGEGVDTVESTATFSIAGQYVEVLKLAGTAAIDGTGNGLNNVIIGNSAANLLNGGTGADRLEGGAGNDRYVIDNAADVVIERDGEGNDRIESTVSFSLAGQFIETLALKGTATIDGTGNSLSNTIYGNAAANSISGGAGDDRLYGSGGVDVLTGGMGADRFIFDSALDGSNNVDSITDFLAKDDSIYLSVSIFGGLSGGSLSASAFTMGSAATDASDRIIYDQATGHILYDGDGNGSGGAVLFATVAAGTTLTSADFIGY